MNSCMQIKNIFNNKMQFNSNACDLLMWSSDSKFHLENSKNRCDPGLKSPVNEMHLGKS